MPATALLVAATLSWVVPPVHLPAVHRSAAAAVAARLPPPCAELKPFRSDANFDYFRTTSKFSISLTKPLGAVLQEVPTKTPEPAGVKIEELNEGGSAFEALKKGDKLTSVMGTDVSKSSFDDVMALLVDAPETVELGVLRTAMTRKKRAAVPPSLLTVDGQQPIEVKQGMVMRTAIQENGLEIHKGMKAKMSSCGGAGQCASCWVEVLEGIENLSEPTAAEERMRKARPESWRMACQSTLKGPVSVEVKSLEKPA